MFMNGITKDEKYKYNIYDISIIPLVEYSEYLRYLACLGYESIMVIKDVIIIEFNIRIS